MIYTNYYNKIKNELVNNEIYKRVKDYSKNKSDLETYYNVGKLLVEAGKHYGEGIIKDYSKRLTDELGKGYSERNLYNMRLFFIRFKEDSILHALRAKLCWNHYKLLITIKDDIKINYYIDISIKQNLSYRELHTKIKSSEYERLDDKTKSKLITNADVEISDFIKNPIIIKSNNEIISEKILRQTILENMDYFLTELGEGFSYIKNEYKIKLGSRYNYIDILLFNYIYNCFVVVELKITELRKEHIGQIESYMNYINKNVKGIEQNNTIGIIICKKDNMYVMEYCSDERVFRTIYEII